MPTATDGQKEAFYETDELRERCHFDPFEKLRLNSGRNLSESFMQSVCTHQGG